MASNQEKSIGCLFSETAVNLSDDKWFAMYNCSGEKHANSSTLTTPNCPSRGSTLYNPYSVRYVDLVCW